eukprot:scaffold244_cov200-Alexandrium_tamarense.AAC.2
MKCTVLITLLSAAISSTNAEHVNNDGTNAIGDESIQLQDRTPPSRQSRLLRQERPHHRREQTVFQQQKYDANGNPIYSNDLRNWLTDPPAPSPGIVWTSGGGSTGSSPNSSPSSSNSRPNSTPSSSKFTSRMGCPSNQRKLKMDINVDTYGAETTWNVIQMSLGKVVMSNSRTYSANDSETVEQCVDSGEQYELVLHDQVGDGICCRYGNGAYALSVEENGGWYQLVNGGNFKVTKMVHLIDVVNKNPSISSRDEEWLVAHNTRREYWHKHYGKSYVPLKWSVDLAKSSRIYAEKLLSTCDSSTIEHDPNNLHGENMAKNKGSGQWGDEYPADKIVGRFIDREVDVKFPHNFHLTQALWRASRYLGCGEASKDWNGGTCRIQVGNCAISKDTWEEKMLADDSGCYPDCPDGGCF